MPLEWKDVTYKLDPTRFTVRTAPALLAKSKAWIDYDKAAGSLRDAIGKITATQSNPKRR
jgi:bifunctional non-homologous end joining protein LigD